MLTLSSISLTTQRLSFREPARAALLLHVAEPVGRVQGSTMSRRRLGLPESRASSERRKTDATEETLGHYCCVTQTSFHGHCLADNT